MYKPFVFDESQRYIIPTSDWGFKRILGEPANKHILIGILQRLLDRPDIVDIDYIPRDLRIPIGKTRDIAFDVYCKCKDGTRIVCEMQKYSQTTFPERALIYSAASLLEQYISDKVKDYRISSTYFIAFSSKKIYPDVTHAPVRIGLCDLDSERTVRLSDKFLQIYVEMPKFSGSIADIRADTPFVDKLVRVFREMPECKSIPENIKDDVLVSIFEAADISRYTKEDMKDYISSVMSEDEYYANINEARDEGLAKGYDRGKAEGLAEGEAKAVREIARTMKSKGMASETISTLTGLSAEEIEDLMLND